MGTLFVLWDVALALYGAFIALAYLIPLIGGYLADRYIGYRRTVIFGGILLVVGHALMGVHGRPTNGYLVVGDETYTLELAVYAEDGQRVLKIDDEGFPIARWAFV